MYSQLPDKRKIQRGEQGPIFSEPWQARIFALVVQMCENGHYSWREWSDRLGTELALALDPGAHRDPGAYYERWLDACETLFQEKNILSEQDLRIAVRTLHEGQLADQQGLTDTRNDR